MDIKFPRTRYFTFGYDHIHPDTGQPLKDCYIELTENCIDEARLQIMAVFGRAWAFEYGPENFDHVIAKWNLRQINLDGSVVE